MTTTTLNTAKGYQSTIDKCTSLQTVLTTASGEKGYAAVVTTEGSNLISATDLIGAIGQPAYDTLAAATLTAINTALSDAKTAAQNSLTAL